MSDELTQATQAVTQKPAKKPRQKPADDGGLGSYEVILELPELVQVSDNHYKPSDIRVKLFRNVKIKSFLFRLHLSLVAKGAALSNGKRVQSRGDAILWVLEQVASE
jgi:hypothetical protein